MAKQNNQIRYRMRPINRIKIREERFATPDNRSLMVKARMKQAVIKILTKLQAFHIYEKIKRNKHCVIPVNKFVKDYHKVQKTGDKAEPNIYGGVVSMGKGNSMTMKGFSSEESEEVFDDEIQSTSEDLEESQNQSVRSGKMSDPNSGGDISGNKSMRSGVEVKGNRSLPSEEAEKEPQEPAEDDMFEHGSEDETKLDW